MTQAVKTYARVPAAGKLSVVNHQTFILCPLCYYSALSKALEI